MQRERNSTAKVREGHSNNLNQMVSFAENVVDCRRYLQLVHLGENFNRQVCIKNKATTCDNCLNINAYNHINVTKEARELVTLVNDLSGRGNVTLLHVADVYKGAKIKKIMEKGHNTHPLYGKGSQLDKPDIHRILKNLVLRNVLSDFVVCTGEFPIVYIKPGKKCSAINASNIKVSIPVNKNSVKRINSLVEETKEQSVEEISNDVPGPSSDVPGPSKVLPITKNNVRAKSSTYAKFNQAKIEKLKVECHEALLEECRRLALEKNQTLSAVMNLTAIKFMSDFLPNTKQEFLKIEHVTTANYTKCGEYFLAITSKYREQVDRLTTAEKLPDRPMFGGTYVAEDDWCSSQSSSSKGTKRKARTGTAGRTKKAKTTYKKRYTKKSPKKWKSKKGGWGSKGGKRGKSGGSGSLGLMPVHFK